LARRQVDFNARDEQREDEDAVKDGQSDTPTSHDAPGSHDLGWRGTAKREHERNNQRDCYGQRAARCPPIVTVEKGRRQRDKAADKREDFDTHNTLPLVSAISPADAR
jgi:hypothetical protein